MRPRNVSHVSYHSYGNHFDAEPNQHLVALPRSMKARQSTLRTLLQKVCMKLRLVSPNLITN
jgi:hypothetical protein